MGSIKRLTSKFVFKIIGWGIVLALALYFVFKDALPYFSLAPEFYEHHWSHAVWLLLHITGGILALLIGPFQFWTGLRKWNMHVHRWTGRIYLGSVAISVISACYILTLPESSFGFRIGVAGLALAWIITTSLAFAAIIKRKILQHKEWMIRSYVVTFGFVFFRLLLEPMIALEVAAPGEVVSAVSWMCWALPLLITEFILQGKKIFREKKELVPKEA